MLNHKGDFCSLCSRVARDVRLLKCSKVTSKFFWNAPNELVRKLCSSHHQQDKPKQKCGMGHADLLHVLLHFLHPNSNSMERPRGLTVLHPNSGTISKKLSERSEPNFIARFSGHLSICFYFCLKVTNHQKITIGLTRRHPNQK